MSALAYMGFALAGIWDHKRGIVPNYVTYPLIGLAFLLNTPLNALLGVLAGGLLGYLLFSLDWWGGADAKLYTALLALTWPNLLAVFLGLGCLLIYKVVYLEIKYGDQKHFYAAPAAPSFFFAYLFTNLWLVMV